MGKGFASWRAGTAHPTEAKCEARLARWQPLIVLSLAKRDAPLGQIVGRQFHLYFVAG